MRELHAESLRNDPRVADARRLLAEAIADHQRAIAGVQPPDPERAAEYTELIRAFGEVRAGTLYYPYLGSGFGHGALVELADGSIKYDLISGIGVHHWGHNHPLMASAAFDAALSDTVMQGNLQQNRESAELAAALVKLAAPTSSLRHVFLSSSGAMANENALKLVFQKKPGADRLLAFEHGFAGRTMTLAQVTDKAAYRIGLPTVLAVDFIPFFDAEHAEASIERAVARLREHLHRHPSKHAAMWFELVQGEGGFYPGSTEFFRALMEELRNAKVAVVADEIQTFGRTPRLFAFEHFELGEYVDVAVVGKMLQVCATLFTDDLRPGPGLLSQTFTASGSAIRAGAAVLDALSQKNFFGNNGRNLQVHRRFVEHFAAIAARHTGDLWIDGPFGLGAMIAFRVFDGSEKATKDVLRRLFDNGVMAFYCGDSPTRIRFLPPVGTITDAQIDEVCAILETTLAAAAKGAAP